MVDCIKECNCRDCENLMYNHPITFIKNPKNWVEKREILVGFKCLLYGQCSETVDGLRDSDLFDDFIFIE